MMIGLSEVYPKDNTDLRHPFKYQSDTESAVTNPNEENWIEQVWSRENGRGTSVDSSSLSVPIRTPTGYSAQNIGDDIDVYQPNPDDFVSHENGEISNFYQQSPDGSVLSGRVVASRVFDEVPSLLRFIVDRTLLASSAQEAAFRQYADHLKSCLSREISKTYDLIGTPLDVDGKPELNIMIAAFSGQNARNTRGLFSERNRYKTLNGKPLPDSNFTEIIFQSPPDAGFSIGHASLSCSNDIHELQHLISYDRKVLSRIPASERTEMDAAIRRGLRGEESGINEGHSHFLEELTGEAQTVSSHQYNFWKNPNLSSLLIEPVYGDHFGQSRARGFTKFLIDYAVARRGGTRNWNDVATRAFLTESIQGPEIGMKNLADRLGTDPEQLVQDFLTHLTMALYSKGHAESFIPPVQSSLTLSGATSLRGVEILDRAFSPSSIPYAPPQLHPFQFQAPRLKRTLTAIMPARGVYFTRYTVPANISDSSKVKFSTNGERFSITLVRTR